MNDLKDALTKVISTAPCIRAHAIRYCDPKFDDLNHYGRHNECAAASIANFIQGTLATAFAGEPSD